MTHVNNDAALKAKEIYAKVSNFSYGISDEGKGTLFADFSAIKGQEEALNRGDLNSLSIARFSDSGEIYHVAFTGYSAIPGATLDRGTFEELSGEVGNLELSTPMNIDLQTFSKEEEMEEKEKMNLFSQMLAWMTNKPTEKIEQLSADPAVVAQQDSRIKQLEQDLADAKKAKREAEVATVMEKFSNGGNFLESQKEEVLTLLSSEYGSVVEKFLEKNKVVDFSVKNKVADVKEIQTTPPEILGKEEKSVISRMFN